jgi:hypothetical protein
MDPLTALGLASNIIQLISFTSDLIGKGREIYRSVEGATIENVELETITKSFQDLTTRFPSQLKEDDLSGTDKQLRELCEACNAISVELIQVIQGLKYAGEGVKWKSFRQALKSVWKEDAIDGLSRRLERYRSQLDTTLLISLREELQSQDKVISKSWRGIDDPDMKPWQRELVEAVRQNHWESTRRQDMATFSLKMSTYTKEQREQLLKTHFLEQLRFTDMGDRYERIENAHRDTFNWIFREAGNVAGDPEVSGHIVDPEKTNAPTRLETSSRSIRGEHVTPEPGSKVPRGPVWGSFVKWLTGEHSMYWITGKPGSGKSTLMKYLYNDPRTLTYLQKWSGDSPLSVGGYFFWNSGTVMQMSKMGLFQALLYECMKNSTHSIPKVFPDRWKSYEFFGSDPRPRTLTELTLAFKTLLLNVSKNFFFVIDGLG